MIAAVKGSCHDSESDKCQHEGNKLLYCDPFLKIEELEKSEKPVEIEKYFLHLTGFTNQNLRKTLLSSNFHHTF